MSNAYDGSNAARATTAQFGTIIVTIIPAVILCVFLFWIVISSHVFQSCVQADSGGRNQKQEESSSVFSGVFGWIVIRTSCTGSWLSENRDAISAFSTAIIALFTFTLWVASNRQYKALLESNASANKAADAAIRREAAWVILSDLALCVRDGDTVQVQRDGFPKHLSFPRGVLKNVGRSPAHVIETLIRLYVGGRPLEPRDYKYAQKWPMGTLIEPGNELPIEGQITQVNLSDEEIIGLTSRTIQVWAYGFVRYQDIFGGIRKDKFLYQWVAESRWQGARVGFVAEYRPDYGRDEEESERS